MIKYSPSNSKTVKLDVNTNTVVAGGYWLDRLFVVDGVAVEERCTWAPVGSVI